MFPVETKAGDVIIQQGASFFGHVMAAIVSACGEFTRNVG